LILIPIEEARAFLAAGVRSAAPEPTARKKTRRASRR
jgi:hypothetical protein